MYKDIAKYCPDIEIENLFAASGGAKANYKAQVVITGPDALLKCQEGRGTMDLSQIKAVIYDEADVFFENNKDDAKMDKIKKTLEKAAASHKSKLQWIFISATYKDEVAEKIEKLVPEAN